MNIKTVDTGLFRGPRPFNYYEVLEVKKYANTSINLESNLYDIVKHKRNEEVNWMIQAHMENYHLKCGIFMPPDKKTVVSFLRLVFEKSHNGGVYVHCYHGVDRTGFMVACYRIVVCGWTVERAYKEMLENGFHWWAYWWWKNHLKMIFNENIQGTLFDSETTEPLKE